MPNENEQAVTPTEPQEPDMGQLWDEQEEPTVQVADQHPDAQEGEQPAENQEQPPAQEQQEQTPPPAPEPESFVLKHMGETRNVGRDEVIRLAQQGMDYERIRTERDQLRQYRSEADPALTLVKTFAEQSGMTVEAYIDYCRQQAIMATGVNEQTARAQVEVEKQQAAINAQKAAEQAAADQRTAIQQQAEQRAAEQRRDMELFLETYPDVKADSIPVEVWQKVRDGTSLVVAYTMWQNQTLQAQIAAKEQNKQNAARTTGSMTTQGESGKKTIAELWDEAEG